MKSIRAFLTLVILSSLTLMIFLSALNGYRDSMAKAEQLFDSELIDKARLLSLSFSTQTINTQSNQSLVQHKISAITENDVFAFQVWHKNTLLLKSAFLPDTAIANFKTGFQDNNVLHRRWRIYGLYNKTNNLWILTAERMDLRYILAENIIMGTILPVVIMVPILGLMIWIIVSYGLLPLRKLSSALSDKRADDLSSLAVEKQPIELTQVVISINDLFRRLKVSFLREKRFASDAAHELRTPISAIKIHLHNLSKVIAEDDQSFSQLKQAVDRMGHLIEQILNLNRTSPEQYSKKFTTIDVYELAQNIVVREYAQFDIKNQQIALEGEHAIVQGDVFSLDILLHNLLSNASKYTPEGGSIMVTVSGNKTQTQLQVQDSGPGVPEEKYERLFDRFYRLGGDRHASGTTGCGLGLAIVKQIADLHHAEIVLAKADNSSGLCVRIIFPKEKLI